ncbi:hypothetical protein [Cohnella abietis]|uniref:Uncharacterized protein n=1 Tax=Cohnella abietis TaxID=2507935 RepID=A0A3T1D2Z6_9BACL|nr:hypothetical protein [Cohnella abietis]BBI32482.1 hypothetical protein KCTCHS21_18810 [Cohnella abietis]
MDIEIVVALVKEGLGIRTTVRDSFITAIAAGVIKELEDEQGLKLSKSNPHHLIFVVDYATWRYQSRGSKEGTPRHLQFRLNNLKVRVGGNRAVE